MQSLRVIFIFLWLILFLANSFASITGDYKFSKNYQSTSGVVTFHHDLHVNRSVEDCAFCHSALRIFGGEVDQLYAHKFCNNCHNAKGGPTKCMGCHEAFQVSKMGILIR
jgi:hypothetical protein